MKKGWMMLALAGLMLCLCWGVGAEEAPAPYTYEVTWLGGGISGSDCIQQDIYQLTLFQDGAPFQTLYFPQEQGLEGEGVRFEDINFDGYADIAVLYGMGATNASYTFFLYSPNEGQFTGESGIWNWLSNYTLYPDKQVIYNHLHNSAMESIQQVLRWQDGRLRLIREVEVVLDEQNPEQLLLILREPDGEWGGLREIHRQAYPLEDAVNSLDIYEAQDTLLWQGI